MKNKAIKTVLLTNLKLDILLKVFNSDLIYILLLIINISSVLSTKFDVYSNINFRIIFYVLIIFIQKN